MPADMFDVTQFRSSYVTFLDDQLKTVNAQEASSSNRWLIMVTAARVSVFTVSLSI
jgi:hypothetical protein